VADEKNAIVAVWMHSTQDALRDLMVDVELHWMGIGKCSLKMVLKNGYSLGF